MALFGLAPQSSIDKSRLSRPFLLNEKAIIIPTSMIVAILAILGGVLWTYTSAETLTAMRCRGLTRNHGQEHESQNDIEMHPQLPAEADEAYLNRVTAALAVEQHKESRLIRLLYFSTMLFVPPSFVATAGLPLGLMGVTAMGALHDFTWRLRFFLPESSSSFLDLDQAVAFAGGVATICFSSYEAYSSRKDESRDDSE
ncbi:hypothetical protein B0A48_04108 [Cryoendolithus antarcticus]|uniref:Uncharacterized protein n=1 Tax=Cryoendolithus antarcticus TaxID=1507870 RepID=A0A1V8THR8_9PEZI|nr:hypothetical protein B0A48_04108 [Cryoendolithus antarcticus]